jgi:crotonobetainyl-CoA hydratase
MTPLVRFEHRGRVAWLTLNRPEKLNAVNAEMAWACWEILEQVEQSPDMWVLVITGAGDRSFCAGADLSEVAANGNGNPAVTSPPPGGFAGIVRHRFSKPLIAAVDGYALGGGMEIALACDLIVASERSTFGLPEVSRGRTAGGGGLVRLPRQVPLRVALEMSLTGKPVSAAEALRVGLINRLVSPEEVLPEASRLAEAICANAPLAVRASKSIIYRSLDASMVDPLGAWDINDIERGPVGRSEDAREGALAFVERRTPQWQGR